MRVKRNSRDLPIGTKFWYGATFYAYVEEHEDVWVEKEESE